MNLVEENWHQNVVYVYNWEENLMKSLRSAKFLLVISALLGSFTSQAQWDSINEAMRDATGKPAITQTRSCETGSLIYNVSVDQRALFADAIAKAKGVVDSNRDFSWVMGTGWETIS